MAVNEATLPDSTARALPPAQTCRTCSHLLTCTLIAGLPQQLQAQNLPQTYPLPMPCGGKLWSLAPPGLLTSLVPNLSRRTAPEPVAPKKGSLRDIIG